jgi:DsbC/DsbD-like thiol-disulfide interchange protein
MQKRFQQSYRERETGGGLLEQGFGLQSTTRGAEVVTQRDGVHVYAALDTPSYRFFQRLWLTVMLTMAPGVHIYGRPTPAGYLPLTIEVAPLVGMVVGAPTWPAPQPYRVAGLAEEFFVYAGTLKVALPVTLTEEVGDQTLQGLVHYQACSERDCFAPHTLRLALPVHAADHIGRPRRP